MKAITTFLLIIGLFWTAFAQPSTTIAPMSQQAFSQALADVQEQFSDRDKIKGAEEIIDNNYLLANQLNQLLQALNFEREKERLAQRAYAHVYDQSNFYQVYPVFSFQSTKDRLRAWVNQQPKNELDTYFRPQPISAANFEQAYQQLVAADFDTEQLPIARDLVDNNYLYAAQVRDILSLLDFKTSQDQFAKYAYPKTYDQQNYGMVIEAMTFTSSKRSLSNWLKGQPMIDYANYGYGNTTTTQVWDSPYDDGDNLNTAIRYSDIDRGRRSNFDTNPPRYYNPPTSSIVVSDADFVNIQAQINQIPVDSDRLLRAKQISDQSNWTSEQVRDLMELLVFDNMRLDFAMYAYGRTLDAQNYYLVKDALSDANNQQKLVAYIQSTGGSFRNPSSITNTEPNPTYVPTNRPQANNTQTVPTTTGGVTLLSDQDFQASKKAIENYSSDSDRLTAAKSVVDEQYIISNQVAQLVELFIFDDVRLEFAKYAYPKTQDKENYEQVVELMKSETSQENLRAYINAN